jgi:hypothetical protein
MGLWQLYGANCAANHQAGTIPTILQQLLLAPPQNVITAQNTIITAKEAGVALSQ